MPEMVLISIKRDSCTENLFQIRPSLPTFFVDQFVLGGDITERRAMQILYQKFSKDLQTELLHSF